MFDISDLLADLAILIAEMDDLLADLAVLIAEMVVFVVEILKGFSKIETRSRVSSIFELGSVSGSSFECLEFQI